MPLPIPPWAADIRASGWANIHDILARPGRLTGVDAYLGDINAHTLVLGKDCAPARVFRQRLASGDRDPYRHDPKLPTNRMLHAVLKNVGVDAPLDGSNSSGCGLYYANAYYLLRDDGAFSGTLPNAKEAFNEGRLVLDYLLSSLVKLGRVIAMGADAYSALMTHLGVEADWRANLEAGRAVEISGIKVFASSHLGSRGVSMRLPGSPREKSVAAIKQDWARVFSV